jgi:hypothetical protein
MKEGPTLQRDLLDGAWSGLHQLARSTYSLLLLHVLLRVLYSSTLARVAWAACPPTTRPRVRAGCSSVAVRPVALADAEPWVRAVGWPAARR